MDGWMNERRKESQRRRAYLIPCVYVCVVARWRRRRDYSPQLGGGWMALPGNTTPLPPSTNHPAPRPRLSVTVCRLKSREKLSSRRKTIESRNVGSEGKPQVTSSAPLRWGSKGPDRFSSCLCSDIIMENCCFSTENELGGVAGGEREGARGRVGIK